MKRYVTSLLMALLMVLSASAHEEPTSFLDLRVTGGGLVAILTASATDLAHDLPSVEPGSLLTPGVAQAHSPALAKILSTRLRITADATPLSAELRAITPIPDKRDVRIELHYPWSVTPGKIGVQCHLFPYDSRHRTFLNVFENGQLVRQEIFQSDVRELYFHMSSTQSIGAVLRQFIASGIHHIFIGPDHILFIVGLLLLRGTVIRLLKIVTAFTVAHSITLGLATFGILTPPASIIEPAIALSIVFVGAHAFLRRKQSDPRLLFAFVFGLIHGFGFANVLQEMELPQAALGWSLLAFNVGVEIGQACIVLLVAPLLALLHRWSALAAARVTAAGACAVTAAGAFWFFQRILP